MSLRCVDYTHNPRANDMQDMLQHAKAFIKPFSVVPEDIWLADCEGWPPRCVKGIRTVHNFIFVGFRMFHHTIYTILCSVLYHGSTCCIHR